MTTRVLGLAACSLAAILLAGSGIAGPNRPANAGQDGIKSNAGGGNGVEAGALLSSEVIETECRDVGAPYRDSAPYLSIWGTQGAFESGPHNVIGPIVTTTYSYRTVAGNPGSIVDATAYALAGTNFKEYTQSHSTTSWQDLYWFEVTDYYHQWQDQECRDLTEDTYGDRDPGASGDHNRAPEPDEVVVQTWGDFEPADPRALDDIVETSQRTRYVDESITVDGALVFVRTCNNGNTYCSPRH